MVRIKGRTISLTRGDTLDAALEIFYRDGSLKPCTADAFVQEGDVIRFALKRRYSDREPVILKEIPGDTLLLHLESSETKALRADWAPYAYDIQLTASDGSVDTFIERGKLIVTDEVE